MDTNSRLGEMVTIPAGTFLMGNNGHEGVGGPEEFPQHPVYLPTCEIGNCGCRERESPYRPSPT